MRIEHVAMYVNDHREGQRLFVRCLDGKSNSGYHNVKLQVNRDDSRTDLKSL